MTTPSPLRRTLARLGAAIALAASALMPAAAQQPPRDPGSGFVAADAPPMRLVEPDVEPVWRAPAVDTLATVRKRGTLRVGVVGVEPLVMHDANGELVGYSIDLARQLADDIGVGVEFVKTSWTQVIPDLLARRFDMIASGLWPTPARSLVINFSAPTSRVGVHLVANRALAAGRTTVADFNRPDVTIVTYGGTMQEGIAKRLFPQARLMRVDGNADYLDPVAQGRAHAALVPTFAPEAMIGTDGDKLVLPLAEPLVSTVTAFGVRKGDPDFLNFLDNWLRFQRDSGWLGERARYWSDPANVP